MPDKTGAFVLIKLILPWPPVELSPNYRSGWQSKHGPKIKYRNDCFYLAKQTNVTFGKSATIPLKITFHPKTKRAPDLDNCLSWAKFGLDSVAKAWGINDKQFNPITLVMGEPVRNGSVVIET